MHSHGNVPGSGGLSKAAAARSVNAPTAVALVGLGLAANLVAGSLVVPLGLAIVVPAALVVRGIPLPHLLRRLVIPWYLAVVVVGTQVFLVGATPFFQIGALTAHTEGLARGLLLASKVLGGSALVLALSLTVPPTDLLGLAARLRVAPVLVEIAMLTYRYLFLLEEEAQRIREAQAARLGHTTWRRSMISYGQLAGMVLVSAYDRAERVYQAMLARGYTGAALAAASSGGQGLHWPLVLVATVAVGMVLWIGGRV